MFVPTNGTIGFSSNGNWTFPIGTVFVKHFELPINDTNSAVTKRLETRFLTLGTNGYWFGYTYKWRADYSDADLLPGALNETNVVTTATGTRQQVWSYPDRNQCLSCHNGNAGSVLGPRTCQMNADNYYPSSGQTDNQLRALNHIGLFNTNLVEASIPTLPKTAYISDTNATLEVRVRSYLQGNCAHCHQPNGAHAFFDARFSTPLEQQNIVGGPVGDPMGIPGANPLCIFATHLSAKVKCLRSPKTSSTRITFRSWVTGSTACRLSSICRLASQESLETQTPVPVLTTLLIRELGMNTSTRLDFWPLRTQPPHSLLRAFKA
jgi:hypothetical protein